MSEAALDVWESGRVLENIKFLKNGRSGAYTPRPYERGNLIISLSTMRLRHTRMAGYIILVGLAAVCTPRAFLKVKIHSISLGDFSVVESIYA